MPSNFVLQTIFEQFYDEGSARDVCGLYSLKVILNNKQVHRDTRKDYWATTLFLDKVLDAYLIYAALKGLGLKSIDDNEKEFTFDQGMSNMLSNVQSIDIEKCHISRGTLLTSSLCCKCTAIIVNYHVLLNI